METADDVPDAMETAGTGTDANETGADPDAELADVAGQDDAMEGGVIAMDERKRMLRNVSQIKFTLHLTKIFS